MAPRNAQARAGHRYAQLSLRYTINVLLAGENAPFSMTRHAVVTVGIVAASLAVALAVPDLAEKIFAVTGATGAQSDLAALQSCKDCNVGNSHPVWSHGRAK